MLISAVLVGLPVEVFDSKTCSASQSKSWWFFLKNSHNRKLLPLIRVVDSRAAFQPVLLPDRQLEDQLLFWLSEPLAGEEQRSHDLLLH